MEFKSIKVTFFIQSKLKKYNIFYQDMIYLKMIKDKLSFNTVVVALYNFVLNKC